jgi:competence protein ComEC
MPASALALRIDARLAAGAVGGWLAVIACLRSTPSRVLLLALIAAGAGAGLLCAARRFALLSVLALATFCVALVLLPLAARLARAQDSPLAAMARRHLPVTAELTVSSDPRSLAAIGPGGAPRVAVDAHVQSVTASGRPVRAGGAVLVLGPAAGWLDVLPGQRVRLDARLQPPLPGDLLVATLSAQSAPVLVGRPPWWQRAAGRVRSSLRAASAGLPAQPRGLLPGLIDGDTRGLDPVLSERFRIAGLSHLVAVSGTNCSILVGAVLLGLRRLGCGPTTRAVVGLAVLLSFVVVARPSPSVVRAAVMAAIALVALAGGRRRDGVPMLSAAVLGLLLWRPQLAADPGFAMSVLATAALLLIAPEWAGALRRRRVPPFVAESLAVAAAAHVVTAPVVAAISGRVSLVAVPANMLAEPVVAVTTVLGFCAALTAPFCLPLAALLAQLAGWPCRWLVWVANFFGSRHGATSPWPGGVFGGLALLGATVVVLWLARRSQARRVLMAVAAVAVVIQIPVRAVMSGWPPPGWVFVACDVGQGDALVLPAGAASGVVVDAGPDPVAVDRCLADLGIKAVPLVLLTHFHLDHVGGLDGAMHGRHVGRVLTGPLPEPASGVEIVDDALARRGLTRARAVVGSTFDVGAVHLDVLAPAVAMRGTRSDPNNSSVITRATVRGVRLLLPGDAEIEAQQSVLAAGVDVSADVLKVPHHGSACSCQVLSFLAWSIERSSMRGCPRTQPRPVRAWPGNSRMRANSPDCVGSPSSANASTTTCPRPEGNTAPSSNGPSTTLRNTVRTPSSHGRGTGSPATAATPCALSRHASRRRSQWRSCAAATSTWPRHPGGW